MRPTFLPFARPDIDERELLEVRESLLSGWLTGGPKVLQFEEDFAKIVGAAHAVAVNSCTAALHLALEAIGLKAGDAVLTTPYTFAATAEVVRYFNATPVLVDVRPHDLNLDPARLEETLERIAAGGIHVGGTHVTLSAAKAVIPVHVGGQVCDLDGIRRVAGRYALKVIEDAAHALPTRYGAAMVGAISDLTCFSFYATKTVTTGEGGMICTENAWWAERCRLMRLHGVDRSAWAREGAGASWKYEIVAPGFKYNMTDVAAALGIAQLRKMHEMWIRRREIAVRYTAAFAALDALEPPSESREGEHAWHLYLLRLRTDRLSIGRDQFIEALHARNIGTSVHFIPLHVHPYYRDMYGYRPEDFPVAYNEFSRAISFPIYPTMTDADVDDVIEAVLGVAQGSAPAAGRKL